MCKLHRLLLFRFPPEGLDASVRKARSRLLNLLSTSVRDFTRVSAGDSSSTSEINPYLSEGPGNHIVRIVKGVASAVIPSIYVSLQAPWLVNWVVNV